MPSLEDLRKENVRLRKMGEQIRQAQITNQKRKNLLKENKRLNHDIGQ